MNVASPEDFSRASSAAAPPPRTGARGSSPPTSAALVGIATVWAVIAYDLYRSDWQWGRETHAPIVILAALYIFATYHARQISARDRTGSGLIAPMVVAATGYLAFLAGKSLQFVQIEALALPLLALSACLAIGGGKAVRALALPLILLLFAVPLPGSVQDSLLLPAKLLLSHAAVALTALLGIPVALSGVVIYVGYDELQIADACSGLDTFISLLSIGLLLLYFDRASNGRVAAGFLLSLGVIAFTVNCLRIVALIGIVHVFGMDAEQTAHDYAAYSEMVVALLLFITAKSFIELLVGTRTVAAHD